MMKGKIRFTEAVTIMDRLQPGITMDEARAWWERMRRSTPIANMWEMVDDYEKENPTQDVNPEWGKVSP